MSSRTLSMTDALYDYLLAHSLREPPVLRELRELTRALPGAGMQISPEQGQFMALLVQLMGAKRCLEVGTFTGYSSTVVALALPGSGHVTCLDVSADYTRYAREAWRKAGVEQKITLHLAPALESLDTLLAEGQAGAFDFAFIDADKGNYVDYFEAAIELVRPGGLIAVDNTLWHGAVADSANTEVDTVAIRAFNDRLHADTRIDVSLVPIGDGLTLARKR